MASRGSLWSRARGSYLPEKALNDTNHPLRLRRGGGVFQEPIPYNPRIGFRQQQPCVETRVVVDLTPVWHRRIKLAIDCHFGRTAYLIAQLLVLIVQPL